MANKKKPKRPKQRKPRAKPTRVHKTKKRKQIEAKIGHDVLIEMGYDPW